MAFILMAQAKLPPEPPALLDQPPAPEPEAEAPAETEVQDQDSPGLDTPEAPTALEAFEVPQAPLTAGVALPSAAPRDMSLTHMFLNADFLVQGVMLLLFLASVATWVVIIEKVFLLRRAGQQMELFKAAATRQEEGRLRIGDDFPELAEPIVLAGIKAARDAAGQETRSECRERIERYMRTELSGLMDRLGQRILFLASVGAVSPFVGLFGTVWGIMHSFIGIAASGETTLAVVAPGIAEALSATALGLAAAIPAVLAYNKINGVLRQITKEALVAIGLIGDHLSRKASNDLKGQRS